MPLRIYGPISFLSTLVPHVFQPDRVYFLFNELYVRAYEGYGMTYPQQ